MNEASRFTNPDGVLSAEADLFLKDALSEFNAKQDLLIERWGWDRCLEWSFDIRTAGLSVHIKDLGQLQAEGFLIGTYCRSDGSFEWAWNNPRYDAFATCRSVKVRELGARLQLSYLEAGMVPAPGHDYVSYLGAVAVKATDSAGLFWSDEGDVQALIVVDKIRAVRH